MKNFNNNLLQGLLDEEETITEQPKKKTNTNTKKSVKEETTSKGGRKRIYTDEELENGNNNKVTLKPYKEYQVEYLNNLYWIKRTNNKSQYIMDLLNKDLATTLGLNEDATEEQLIKAWNKFKEKNNI